MDMKLGARNSAKDKERIMAIKEAASSIIATAGELQPDEVEQETPVKGMLSVDLPRFNVHGETLVKAAGEYELEVLLIPFGGPDNGKDTDGQFFNQDTNTQHDIYKTIPAYYYHGFDPDGKPQGDPVVIGRMTYDHTDAKGHWYRAILDRTNEFAKRIWEAAKKGLARASSGTIGHIARAARDGFIKLWPVVEGSLIDEGDNRHPANAYAVALPVLKARQPDLLIPGEDEPTEAGDTALTDNATIETKTNKENEMEKDEVMKMVADEVAKLEATKAEAAKKEADIQAEIDKAVKAKAEELEKKFAESNRLPSDRAPYMKKFGDTDKFDYLDAADTAVLIGVVKSAGHVPSEGALKALSLKLEEDKTEVGTMGRKAMKAAGIKAGEIDYSTSSGYGDEWVGVAYSSALWNSIRGGSEIINKIPAVEFPKGVESMTFPLESTDPVWYKVAENTTNGSTVGAPAPTITSSRLATSNASLTLAKLGARVFYTGELEESSMVPFASELRRQLAESGMEYLESAIIDGDNVADASTNINDIAGTPAASDWFMVWDGFRVSPLVTTTANSRSAAGSLDITDYLETVKLMGSAGLNGLDQSKVGYIVDLNTYYKTLSLPEVLTRDVYSSPTIENGKLTRLFGYPLYASPNMHKASADRKANSAGKIDVDTTTNNAYGAILAVRFDQWKLGWMRHIKIETTRFAASDSTEIVAQMRVGLKQRDTEAAAITYYVGV